MMFALLFIFSWLLLGFSLVIYWWTAEQDLDGFEVLYIGFLGAIIGPFCFGLWLSGPIARLLGPQVDKLYIKRREPRGNKNQTTSDI